MKKAKGKSKTDMSAVCGDILLSAVPMKSRTQTYNPHSRKWIKRDGKTGLFCAVKKNGEPWRRVSVEKNTPVVIAGW